MTDPTDDYLRGYHEGDGLLPCPFCGGEAELREGEECAYVQCLDVKAHRGPFVDGDNNAAAEAVEMWNYRVPLPVAPAREVNVADTELRDAAQAVVDRWDTPAWKDAEPTGAFINRLRRALAGEGGQ